NSSVTFHTKLLKSPRWSWRKPSATNRMFVALSTTDLTLSGLASSGRTLPATHATFAFFPTSGQLGLAWAVAGALVKLLSGSDKVSVTVISALLPGVMAFNTPVRDT